MGSMVHLVPTRRYRLLLSIGVWLLCAVFGFFVGAMILETWSVLAAGKLLLLVVVLTWVYRQLTRIGEIRVTDADLRVLQPWYAVRIPLAQVERVQQRAQTRVMMQAGLQTRVHRVVLDVHLVGGATKPVVISILTPDDAQWVQQLLQIASTKAHAALQAHLATRMLRDAGRGYLGAAFSFLVISTIVALL